MNLRITEMLFGLLPMLFFLAGLRYMDSFKLVRLPATLITIGIGCLAAVVAAFLNGWVVGSGIIDRVNGIRYAAPVIEETLKAAFLVHLLRAHRVGFMVDSAIRGFAIGTGFAFVENLYYWLASVDAGTGLWIVRGFGTALMHGGTTAIFGILAKSLLDRGRPFFVALLPGWLLAVGIHSIFNHFFLSPSLSTIIILLTLPVIMIVAFTRSERATRDWLGEGFDLDRELLEMITTGTLSETRVGSYLKSLEDTLPGPVMADMLCLLRLYAELSITAKGVMLMRDAGFTVPEDDAVKEQFAELQYLERNIGKAGLLALHPFLHRKDKDLWQLKMLQA